jgi:hypothetical protein
MSGVVGETRSFIDATWPVADLEDWRGYSVTIKMGEEASKPGTVRYYVSRQNHKDEGCWIEIPASPLIPDPINAAREAINRLMWKRHATAAAVLLEHERSKGKPFNRNAAKYDHVRDDLVVIARDVIAERPAAPNTVIAQMVKAKADRTLKAPLPNARYIEKNIVPLAKA